MMLAPRSRILVGLTVLGAMAGCAPNGESATEASSRRAISYECRAPLVEASDLTHHLELEGQPLPLSSLSVVGHPGHVAAGDIVRVALVPIVLGPPGHYRFSVDGDTVMLSFDGGPTLPVAMTVASPTPLMALSDEQRQGLRGLRLTSWSDGLAAALTGLDLEHLAVALEYEPSRSLSESESEASSVSRTLPENLRYLELDTRSLVRGEGRLADPERGIAALTARASRLRYFVLDGSTPHLFEESEAFDARWLQPLTSLAYLRLKPGAGLEHVEGLAALTGLRVLDLSAARDLDDLNFVQSLPRLRRLDVQGTRVSSLESLSDHPSIEVVEADGALISTLPTVNPPHLRTLSLLSTPLSSASAVLFTLRAPAVHFTHGWNQTLADTIACADRIRVRTGGLCHRDLKRETTMFEVTDEAEIEAALPLLYIAEDQPLGHCMCCGDPTIEFYSGDRFLTALGFHHGRSLRWRGWPSDGSLAPADATVLCQWMEQHGAAGVCSDG